MSALVTGHLPLLAGAPDGIKKLRELILELAVRGKLVPQDADDEPASELLRRTQVEKERLIAEGKVRPEKLLVGGSESEVPFGVPAGWVWSSLAQIALVNPRNSAEDALAVSFVPMTLIGTNFDGIHAQESRLWGEVKQGFTHFAEGDVGVAKITPCFENSKACVFSSLTNGLGAGTTELHIIRPLPNSIDPRYVLAFVKSPQFLCVGETRMTGTAGQKRLPKDFVESNPFPLPPLAEQRRIVAKVDELMALCNRLEARQADAESAHAQLVEALLGSLTQARYPNDFATSWQRLSQHFHTLFTTESSIDALKQTVLQLAVMGKLVPQESKDELASDLLKRIGVERRQLVVEKVIRAGKELPAVEQDEAWFELPKTWAWVRLGQIGDWGAGATPARGNLDYYGGEIPWFKSGELSADFIDQSEESVTELALKDCSLRRNRVGDVLVAMYGATIGKTAILAVPATTNQAVCACTPFNGLFNRYLLLTLKALKSNFIGQGAGGAQPNISREKIIATVIGLPPEAEQHRIVAKVDQLMALCDKLKSRLTQARQLNEQLASTLVERGVA